MIELDPRLVEFMHAARAHYRAMEEGDFWGGVDAGLVISEQSGIFEINSWERGTFDGLKLTGATLPVVETYLAMRYGNSWRLQQHWDILRIAASITDLPPGYEVTEGAHRSGCLLIQGTPPVHVKDLLDTRTAVRLARALSVPLGELIASYQDADGLPAFPQDRPEDV